MSQPWRDVAIYGTAAFTGLLTGLPTGEAANCVKVLFDGREPNLEAIAKRAERVLAPFSAHDQRGAGDSFHRAIVEGLTQYGWSAATAVSHELLPDAIAAAVIPDGDPRFTDELKGQEPFARQIVAAVYDAVLADPRLAPLAALRREPALEVGEPTKEVLLGTPGQFRAVRVHIVEPGDRPGSR